MPWEGVTSCHQAGEGCPVRTPGERGSCVCSIQPSPLAAIAGKGRARTTCPNLGRGRSKIARQQSASHPGMPESMGGSSDPGRPPEHPISDLSVCPSFPASSVTGAQGRCWEDQVHTDWGSLRLRKGTQGRHTETS